MSNAPEKKTMSWLTNLTQQKNLAGEHPEAKKAYAPAPPKKVTRARENAGSLDLGEFEIALEAGRLDGEPLVEVPRRAEGLGNGTKRIHLRLSEDLEQFLYANTRGSVNAVAAALIVYGFKQLQASGDKLILKAADGAKDTQADAGTSSEAGATNNAADQGSAD